MNAIQYARSHLEQNFNLVNMVVQGLTEQQYNWTPGGTCNPISKSHVHIMTAVDLFVNAVIKGGARTWPDFAAKHGLPLNALEIWKHEGQIPLAALQEYGQSVQKDALDYIVTLSDSDLDREIETNFFGKQSVAWILQLAGMHAAGHAGDMSSVKGMQGLKGLPF